MCKTGLQRYCFRKLQQNGQNEGFSANIKVWSSGGFLPLSWHPHQFTLGYRGQKFFKLRYYIHMFLSLKILPSACSEQMGRAMQKRVFRHMRTAKVQISLRIRVVRSGHSLSTSRVYKWRANARMRLCTGA